MFSGARNPTVLLEILSDVTGSQKSKMAASNQEIRISRLVDMIATKFQRLPPFFGGKVSNGTILAVGISLLSCLQVEIYVFIRLEAAILDF